MALAVSSVAASSYPMPSHTPDRSKSSVSPREDANDKQEWPSTSLRSV